MGSEEGGEWGCGGNRDKGRGYSAFPKCLHVSSGLHGTEETHAHGRKGKGERIKKERTKQEDEAGDESERKRESSDRKEETRCAASVHKQEG